MTDLSCYYGETPEWEIDCTRNSQAVDLTGATVEFAVKQTYSDSISVLAHSTADDDRIVRISDALGGKILVSLPTGDTLKFPQSYEFTGVYTVRVIEASGVDTVVEEGAFTVGQTAN